MLELNKVLLTGNLTRDPEMKALPSGTQIAELRLAVNRRSFDRNTGERKDESIFIDVTVWDKQAEFCRNYMKKGSGIFVEGRLKMDTWEDKQSGQSRSKIAVIAERLQFVESKSSGGGGDYQGGGGYNSGVAEPPASYPERSAPAAAPNPAPAPRPAGNTEDDLPF